MARWAAAHFSSECSSARWSSPPSTPASASSSTGRSAASRPSRQRLADGYIDIKGLRLTVTQAAWRLSEDLPADVEVSTAAFWAAEAGHRVAHTTVHVHGGVGIDTDHPGAPLLPGRQADRVRGRRCHRPAAARSAANWLTHRPERREADRRRTSFRTVTSLITRWSTSTIAACYFEDVLTSAGATTFSTAPRLRRRCMHGWTPRDRRMSECCCRTRRSSRRCSSPRACPGSCRSA